jgi:hypothetical protein
MVWTQDLIFFAREADSTTVDTIPLNEILSVSAMSDTLSNGAKRSHSIMSIMSQDEDAMESALKTSEKRENDVVKLGRLSSSGLNGRLDRIFQIKTIAEGFNSGRTYYLEAESVPTRRSIVPQLDAAIKSSKQRAEARSVFERLQGRVKGIYNSNLFQGAMALFIILVSHHWAHCFESVEPTCEKFDNFNF